MMYILTTLVKKEKIFPIFKKDIEDGQLSEKYEYEN